MSDAVGNALGRKVALDFARAALRSGARSELESALVGLPETGQKAVGLASRIGEALSRLDRGPAEPKKQAAIAATCVSDGVGYEFIVAETGDIAFFVAKRVGAIVEVTINSAHPFGQHLIAQEDWANPTVLTLLGAWAHYELDQSNMKRQQAARDARVDWGRVVRRLLTTGIDFRLE